MVNFCHLYPLECLNNGQCAVNIGLNTTYCQCDPCHEGIFCENDVVKQTQFDTTYVHLIIFIIGLCFSVLNNSLTLELCIDCRRIRRTNCGVYLIIYSILSLISSIFLVADKAVEYYSNQLNNNGKQYEVFHCYVGNVGYNMLVYLCIWFSSCIAFECGLVISFDCKMTNRWRSFVTVMIISAIAGGSVTPMLLYKCGWRNIPSLKIARGFFVWFYISTGILIYVLATLLILISFTRRIRQFGTENGSFIKTFLKLLRTHLFIFIPPITYAVCYIPFTIVFHKRNRDHSYFQCGISTGEYTIKVIIEMLQGVPFIITWLLFVYPSKVYMTEFYQNTWSGQHSAGILSHFR